VRAATGRRCRAGAGAGAGQAPAAPRIAPVPAGRCRQHRHGAARGLGGAGRAPRGGGGAGPGPAGTRSAAGTTAVPGRRPADRAGPGGRAPAHPLAGGVRGRSRERPRHAAGARGPGPCPGHRRAQPRLAAGVGRRAAGMIGAGLPLRDVLEPVAPPWWPPAPGWWIVAGVVALLLLAWGAWRWRKARRRRLAGRLFDQTVDAARTPAAQVAAISALLRRAARQVEPGADVLQGED